MLGVYKVLGAEMAGSKFKQSSASKQKAAAAEQSKNMGIEARKGTPVKKSGGSSRGGVLSKKERETSTLGSDLVTGNVEQ